MLCYVTISLKDFYLFIINFVRAKIFLKRMINSKYSLERKGENTNGSKESMAIP